ncbi:nucleotidyltransferase family protein [Lacimicrobium alkaliphilum]|uniref:Alcohol dehydrogenase n=1 Tax=Lacimicrobium alkaliphilum TaxID=1526571 RepID=A0ABQ1RLT0_9ALTE|nr:nucleotidyltransferase family protein [Lacimicrobium alkaliphilum]GGD72547.1 alcohol dehydrogenase [Lacimicrobium alkaliphilum]
MNWQDALLSPDSTLEEAISMLDRAALRIVLVVDKEHKLLGTLTDGDIRRSLLKHQGLETNVREVMNTSPRSVTRQWTREQILSEMRRYQLLQLPVLNESGLVVGLETLHGQLQRQKIDNPVFLMAGGLGTRLRPLTQTCPKPLLHVGGKPILEVILQRFVDSGFHRFFISTHYLSEMIEEHFGDGSRWGVDIQYVREDEPLGTGGALGLMPEDQVDLPLLVMNGDLLTSLNFHNLLSFHQQHGGIASMCVREYEHQVPYGVVEFQDHLVQGLTEKPIQRFFINAGIYVLSPEFVNSIPANTRIDLPTLLEQQIKSGNRVNLFPAHEYWLDIGRMEDFIRAQTDIESL